MRELFFFDNMVTPKFITILYWVLLFSAVLGGVGIIFSGSIFSGLMTILGGVIFARIWCELMVVLFKINANLQKIADRNVE
ncbi:hypothetical protein CBP31_01030 [Oceanisphaera profunda]|uniref:DUF4282 domain-containing protein n=1 Tax=Oceanisphaera profunda TaxID=1416627 RepID=A0A1Y0D1K0_9GAMM|nr:DUF4282 domain-containing protein [Oceanisphaera profunda]ART81388.1 hypothetical protein CBP31_01030 [Oceanisphaera profunda]